MLDSLQCPRGRIILGSTLNSPDHLSIFMDLTHLFGFVGLYQLLGQFTGHSIQPRSIVMIKTPIHKPRGLLKKYKLASQLRDQSM